MIKIEIPESSLSIPVSDIHKVSSDSGFYFMRDSSGGIVYIGESLNLRKRLTKHMTGKSSTTRRFHHVFHSVDVFIVIGKTEKFMKCMLLTYIIQSGMLKGMSQ